MGATDEQRKTGKGEERPYGSSPGRVTDYLALVFLIYKTCVYDCFSLYLQEHLSNRDLVRATDAQKQEAEEEQRKCFLAAKQKMMKLRNDRKKEMLR